MSKQFSISRNEKNAGKKRPVCACGAEMTFVLYKGYYDEREYWICENPECKTDDSFEHDTKSMGAYST